MVTKKKMSDTSSKLIMKPVRDHDVVSTLSSMPQASYSLDINLEKLMYCAITIIHKHEMDNKAEFVHCRIGSLEKTDASPLY